MSSVCSSVMIMNVLCVFVFVSNYHECMLFHFQWDDVAESKTLAVGFDRDYGQCQFWNLCLQRWVNFLLVINTPGTKSRLRWG